MNELNLSEDSTTVNGEVRDLAKEQEEQIIPIAREVIKIMASKELVMGKKITEKERIECYGAIYKEIIAIFKDKNILLQDITPMFSYCLQALQITKDIVEMSTNRNLEKADVILWKMEKEAITINHLDSLLKGNASDGIVE